VPYESARTVEDRLANYRLMAALIDRRSRRFGKGMTMHVGPLAHASRFQPEPLTKEEEAALAFAAGGITGYAFGDLPYGNGDVNGIKEGGGQVMVRFIGRTAASGEAIHAATIFVLNDSGVRMLRRPQDLSTTDYPQLITLAREGKLLDLYEKSSVHLMDHRPTLLRKMPFVAPFNTWDTNLPGTTYFLPVIEYSAFYINLILTGLGEEIGMWIVDERNNFCPAGLKKFAKSRGGPLNDDLDTGIPVTLGTVETFLAQFAAVETGAMFQNLGLMAEALGLGGYIHQAQNPEWLKVLGFDIKGVPLSQVFGLGFFKRLIARLLGKDRDIPTALGLKLDGNPLIRPFCPPWYPDMEKAVYAFIDYKYGAGHGTLRENGTTTAFKDGNAIQGRIPRYSDTTIAATIAHCQYVYEKYGRFPAIGPLGTVLAYQAHHVDSEFYQNFYRADALGSVNRVHDHRGSA